MFELQSTHGALSIMRLAMADGVKIGFRFFQPSKPATACAIVLPGGAMHGDFYVTFARLLASASIKVVVIDPRGHGLSEGTPGYLDRPSQYTDDFACCFSTLRRMHDLPLFVLAHSGSAAIALNALSILPERSAAGIALLTPSFADDSTLFPTDNRFLRRLQSLRYWLGLEAPVPAPRSSDEINIRFSYAAYLLARLTGLGARRAILTFPAMRNEAPYSYSAAAVAGMRAGRLETLMSAISCPMFLATGGADPYVNSAAVQTVLPWALPPDCSMTAINYADGDHYTVLLKSARALSQWIGANIGGHKP
ncbi:alpha/beta hydrolase [Bradyrhizobium sp.]|jgi:alpha-beta hydrolase superfamily lysophospholipase|uniref:alpha/beta hydrolase n=1 Tax=Bradyrhizobium sp. TaxID=376 RepID=UPI003C278170